MFPFYKISVPVVLKGNRAPMQVKRGAKGGNHTAASRVGLDCRRNFIGLLPKCKRGHGPRVPSPIPCGLLDWIRTCILPRSVVKRRPQFAAKTSKRHTCRARDSIAVSTAKATVVNLHCGRFQAPHQSPAAPLHRGMDVDGGDFLRTRRKAKSNLDMPRAPKTFRDVIQNGRRRAREERSRTPV